MFPNAQEIEIQSLLDLMDSGSPILLVDVRNEEEFAQWKIEARRPVAMVHIPYFDFIEDDYAAIQRVPRDDGRTIVVVCAKGGSSAMVVDLLREAGIPARNLKGGMLAYGEHLQPVRVQAGAGENRFSLLQIHRRGKGCLSYVIVAESDAIVVDPSRHIDVYESIVTEHRARIVRVLETHVHADHVSGGPELCRRQNYLSYSAGVGCHLMQDGDTTIVGGVRIETIRTPGHTPDSVSYLVDNRYLLSGDTLFVNSVGRPDLGGDVVEWSKALYATLKDRLAIVSDETIVLPAHCAGAAEIGPDGLVSTTLGDLRRRMPEFHLTDENDFVQTMQNAVTAPPESYAEIIRVNLGTATADADRIAEWELGKNQCAASARLEKGMPH
jgi:glyoxylase-like metal-dependent hydrolase (beta-lactamase superfamily II)/rhodanese-related sulfurtransferase